MAFILVLFQGWLGGQVVRSGLSEGIITLHMVIAMVLVGLLIFATFKAFSGQVSISLLSMHKKPLLIGTGILLFFTMIQMILGTQVREAVDLISSSFKISFLLWKDYLLSSCESKERATLVSFNSSRLKI